MRRTEVRNFDTDFEIAVRVNSTLDKRLEEETRRFHADGLGVTSNSLRDIQSYLSSGVYMSVA